MSKNGGIRYYNELQKRPKKRIFHRQESDICKLQESMRRNKLEMSLGILTMTIFSKLTQNINWILWGLFILLLATFKKCGLWIVDFFNNNSKKKKKKKIEIM
jgi:hypothetical protein